MIQNFLEEKIVKDGIVKEGNVFDVYLPQIEGKEKRKQKSSSQGFLGVEGMSEEIIINALKKAGCEINNEVTEGKQSQITKADLYILGLSGGKDSAVLREKLSREINIPARISANMLLDVLNRLYTYDELVEIVQRIQK